MVEGLFVEVSEEEMLSVNGGCGSTSGQGAHNSLGGMVIGQGGGIYNEIEKVKDFSQSLVNNVKEKWPVYTEVIVVGFTQGVGAAAVIAGKELIQEAVRK